MRFTAKFRGQEANELRDLLRSIGIGDGLPVSLQDFTRTAVIKEVSVLVKKLKESEHG